MTHKITTYCTVERIEALVVLVLENVGASDVTDRD